MQDRTQLYLTRSERIRHLTQLLWLHGRIGTRQVIQETGLSEATVRRDMKYLAAMNDSISRCHGGLIFDATNSDLEHLFEVKTQLMVDEKQKIAKKAISLIDHGDQLLIDSGTTCLMLARALNKQGLRVVTTDIKIAEQLGRNGNIETWVIGGKIRAGYFSIGEELAEKTLEQVPVRKAFMSCDAIDINAGMTNHSLFEMNLKRKIIEQSDQVILICDATKFDQKALYKYASLKQIDCIITNQLDPVIASRYRETGVEIIEA